MPMAPGSAVQIFFNVGVARVYERSPTMPFISVRMLEGRNQEQKKKLVESITDAVVTICGADRDHVHVVIEELPKDSWARGGVMASER